MKRAYIAGGVLVVLLLCCGYLSYQLSQKTSQLSEEVAALASAIRADSPDVSEQFSALQASWERSRPLLVALNGRANCEPVEAAFSTIPAWIEAGNNDELLSILSQLSVHITELWELQSPQLINLF